MEDKKSIASILLKKSAPEMEADDSQDESIAKEASMEDFIQAIEKKDSKAALAAFSSLMSQCSSEE